MLLKLTGRLWLLLFVIGFPSLVLSQPQAPSGYQLAWYDEFSGTSLDTSLWTPANTNVPTNNSLQDYLPQQVTVSNGNLVITSENIPSRGLPYRSGLVTSTALQKHGRWDVRAKLPTSTGMWPAIWLLADAPWPSQGEIDIMENRGNEPNITSSAFHYGSNSPYQHHFVTANQSTINNGQLVNYHQGFHTYSVEWDPNQVRFYVDNVHHWTVRDRDVNGFLANNIGPMRLIINTAVGGDFLENPNASTIWPQRFEVDYVHAFSRTEVAPVLSFENGGFEAQGGSMAHWTVFGNSINNVGTSNLHVAEGNSALKLYGRFSGVTNYSGVEQGVSVAAGDRLTASARAWIAANDSIAGSQNRVELKIDYYRELYGEYGQAEYISSDFFILADGTSPNNVWLNGELNSIVPEGAVEARLALVFRQVGNATGAVYVDQVQFSVVPEPGSAAVFGLVTGLWMMRRGRIKSQVSRRAGDPSGRTRA
jgi:beta-glucanase (GH16 family)